MTKLKAARGPHGIVTCAQPSCRHELPGIWRMRGEDWLEEDDEPWLFIADGWGRGPDGVWRVTPRARRSRGFLNGRVHDVRRHDSNPTVDAVTGGTAPAKKLGATGQKADDLPTVIVCPFCGAPQWLDPDALQVDPHPVALGPKPIFALMDDRVR